MTGNCLPACLFFLNKDLTDLDESWYIIGTCNWVTLPASHNTSCTILINKRTHAHTKDVYTHRRKKKEREREASLCKELE
ncbi:hypothetical protein EVAR_16605_1 [Eumeta japonica]|uniref:Uncharacterized protein n=1 Tax=Eumeta variegata TaxID=151549 RepID=A0A4C1UZD8_EUMVA|nr:hypothetical protein EVAR_16605_1 [Eumeta japonica]